MAVEYWLYCIGFLDLFALNTVNPLIILYFREIGFGPSVIGLYSSLYGLIQLFSSPYVGHWSDKHGNIGILFICLIFSGLGYGFSALVLDFISFLALARIFLGFFKHTQNLCRNALAEIVGGNKRTECVGRYNSLSVIGVILGSTVSGYLSEHIGMKSAIVFGYLFCWFIFVLNAVIVYIYIRPLTNYENAVSHSSVKIHNSANVNSDLNASSRESESASSQSLIENESFFRKNSFFTRISEINWKLHGGLFVTQFLLSFSVMVYRSSFILGVKHHYPHLTSVQLGYLMSYIAFLGFVIGYCCSWVFSHQYYLNKEEKLQLHAILIVSIGMVILALSDHFYSLLIGLAVLAVGTVTSRACGVSVIVKRCNSNEIGKLSGLSYSVISLSRFFAPIISGFIQEFSYAAPAYFSLFVSLLALTVFYFQVYLHPSDIREKVD